MVSLFYDAKKETKFICWQNAEKQKHRGKETTVFIFIIIIIILLLLIIIIVN